MWNFGAKATKRYQYKEDGFNDARKCNCATVVSAESFILRISR